MTNPCVLETDGYRISFGFQGGTVSQEYADLRIEMTLDPYFGHVTVQSVPTCIALRDMQRLAGYFAEHIEQVRQNPDRESPVFVPTELGFQVQALAGAVDQDREEEFSVRFFVNVGQSKAKGHRVYVGGEFVVTLEHLRTFLTSLHNAVTALSCIHA